MRIALFILLFSFQVLGETMGPREQWSLIGSVLNISEDKEVILFNKGHEDGLAEGDHAWFWTHKDKGFRAECIKVSESRSIWQIYRTENSEVLQPNVALRARQATKPIFVPSPEDSSTL